MFLGKGLEKVQEHSRATKALYSLALVFFVGMCWSNLAAALVLGSSAASLVFIGRRLGVDLQQEGRQLPLSLALGAAFLCYSLNWGFLADQSLLFIGSWGFFYSFAMLAFRYRISSFSLRLPLIASLVVTKALLVVAPAIVSPELLQVLALEISRIPLGVGSFLGLLGDYVGSRSYGSLLLLIFPGLAAEQTYWWQRSEVMEPAHMVKTTKVVLNSKLQLPTRNMVTITTVDENTIVNVERLRVAFSSVSTFLTDKQFTELLESTKKNGLWLMDSRIVTAQPYQLRALENYLGSCRELFFLVEKLKVVPTAKEFELLSLITGHSGNHPTLELRYVVDMISKAGVTNMQDVETYLTVMEKRFPYMVKVFGRSGMLDVRQKLLEYMIQNPVVMLSSDHPLTLTTSFSDLQQLRALTGKGYLKSCQVLYSQQRVLQLVLGSRELVATELTKNFDYMGMFRSANGAIERLGVEVKTVSTLEQWFSNMNWDMKEFVDELSRNKLPVQITDSFKVVRKNAAEEGIDELYYIVYRQYPSEPFGMSEGLICERLNELLNSLPKDQVTKPTVEKQIKINVSFHRP